MSSNPFQETSSLTLVNETALDNGDPVLTKHEVNQYSTKVLRKMAAAADTDEVHGKSVGLEMRAYFGCQYTLSDFE